MSFFSKIKNAIFRKKPVPAEPAPDIAITPAATGATSTVISQEPETLANVDVEAILDDASGRAGQPLNWRTSIVDLLKLLELDSSLTARKELAAELGHSGAFTGTAEQNIWLHKQVLNKLAENGGKLPADLLD